MFLVVVAAGFVAAAEAVQPATEMAATIETSMKNNLINLLRILYL
jgi:hypothetical protein